MVKEDITRVGVVGEGFAMGVIVSRVFQSRDIGLFESLRIEQYIKGDIEEGSGDHGSLSIYLADSRLDVFRYLRTESL